MNPIDVSELFPGTACGERLVLQAPLSFWGGVDPASGQIINPRHPQQGQSITGRVLIMPELIGSSSSSAVLLELIRCGQAPAALVLGQVDAILVLGCIVGRELNYHCPPVVLVEPTLLRELPAECVILQAGSGTCVEVA